MYYTNRGLNPMDKATTAAFQRTLQNYRFDAITGRLLHRLEDLWTIAIIREEVSSILADTHDKMGHFSSKIILENLRYRVYWPKMAEDVKDYIKGCIACAKWAHGQRSQPLKPITATKPFDLLGMDFVGPFNITKAGNQYVLNIVDYFSGFMIPTSLPSASGRETITSLRRTFSRFPRPAATYLDIGTHFNNKAMKDYCEEAGITMIFAPAAAHKSVGMIERSNEILQQAFKRTMSPTLEWDEALSRCLPGINSRLIDHLGYSPMEIVFGCP